MLRIFKPQHIRYFRDGFPFQEHLTGLFHQIMPDILRGGLHHTGWYKDSPSSGKGRRRRLAQAMAALLELVIVHDAYQRMQRRRAHIPGIIIDTLDQEDLFHDAKIGNSAQFP